MKSILTVISSIVLAFVLFFAINPQANSPVVKGSGSESYNATNTAAFPTNVGGYQLLKTGYGVLGSVVVTTNTIGQIEVYDATTTRNGATYGTTTLAKFGPSATTNTYTFDVAFSKGLLVVNPTGNLASTTITWK